MKNVNIIIAAVLLFAALSGIGSAVPRAPQDMGLLDTNYTLVPAAECRECHTAANDEHHAMVFSSPATTTLKCLDCHPSNNTGQPIYETDCKTCHKAAIGWNASQTQNITVWDENTTVVNLSRIRGRGSSVKGGIITNAGLPHHNTTKNATWNSQKIAYWAADRKCDLCHGTGIVSRYDDGHYVPTYNFSMISPLATFKINATNGGGVEWGGCFACHDDDLAASPELLNPDETHHGARMYQGYQCNDCHVSKGFKAEMEGDRNPDPNANYMKVWLNVAYPTYTSMFNWDTSTSKFEFRNATMIQNGDTLNGTGCEKCHSVQTLHNIEVDADINIPAQVPGKGHIGNASDCNGCHSAVSASDANPFPGEKSVSLNSVTPGKLTAGVATDVTLTGDNFVENPYQTVVLVDGQAVTQKSITGEQIVVTIPSNLAVGGHGIQVKKGDVTSGLRMLSVASPTTITSAKLTSGVLTITGTGFGNVNPGMVTINKAGGAFIPSTSWTDTQIVATSADAIAGDSVTVTSLGSATATITAGTFVLSDVTSSDWFYTDVMYLFDHGVTTGYLDGTYKPNNQISRAELATFIYRARNLPAYTGGITDFPDVPTSHWAYNAIMAVKRDGIIQGYLDGNFGPDNLVTRAETSTMITKARSWTYSGNDIAFPDVPSTHWSYPYVMAAKENTIVLGYPDGSFGPDNLVTRAESGAMVTRMMKK